MTDRRLNQRRLATLVAGFSFLIFSSISASWRNVVEFPGKIRGFQYDIVAEDYAKRNATTVKEINRRFLKDDQERFRKERDSGLPECDFFFTKRVKCAVPPLTHGGPLIGFPKETFGEIAQATIRALPSLKSIARDMIFAALSAIMLCMVGPRAVMALWNWIYEPGN